MTIHVFVVEVVENALAYCLLDLSVGLFPRSTGSVNTLCCCITLLLSIHQYVGEMFDVYNFRWVGILALEGSTSTKVQIGITLLSAFLVSRMK